MSIRHARRLRLCIRASVYRLASRACIVTDSSLRFYYRHAVTQETLVDLYDKLSRKANTGYTGQRVGAGWLKYEFNDTIWNLDDDADYIIFVWRQQQQHGPTSASETASTSTAPVAPAETATPTLHLHDPHAPLPSGDSGDGAREYLNPAYYAFRPSRVQHPSHHSSHSNSSSPRPRSGKSRKTKGSKQTTKGKEDHNDDGTPTFKREFEKFHGENGVRTVLGSIGPVSNVRMLLKSGYRHVYISRKFARDHGFIPADAAPGHYGYGGLVWPITLTTASSSPFSTHPDAPPAPARPTAASNKKRTKDDGKPKPTMIQVFLSEEPHFDVVLGRSFFERRQIKTSPTDPTDVVCLDTGEKLECELVILKDGMGEIVTVT
ncbi:hypothetical protein MSAN_01021000 [Mycena sanguinolenta]|uniref:Uncharacterized protein n=1 Tax=Mycena sanguinolenta TaxID=230812 RepID=A0A8H6YP87_9AGAR|nr:hypothetical protein MSAN_01021000 [Mycena sanguinolenta]